METATMGRVIVPATIENLGDVIDSRRGTLALDRVRRLEVSDARVDTGATYVAMPRRLIDQLGLAQTETKRARTPTGLADFPIFESVRLTVQGRWCEVQVSEVSEVCPVLIGFLPLEMLDFVVDSKGRCLVGNPDHGGEHMIDMF